MAAKRFRDENPCLDKGQPREKRVKIRLAAVIRKVMMENSMKIVYKALEPMIRRLVHEEMERSLRRCTRSLPRSSSLQLPAQEPSTLELWFSNSLSLPIFTGTKIKYQDGAPLRILLRDKSGSPVFLPNPIKIDLVVLDGDFPSGERNDWTSKEFNHSIVLAREGKRPLLAGDISAIMRSDCIVSVGELELTDNSSWIRGRRFRIGAKVSPGSYRGAQIREAITEAFVVKDHRGELYKKHHPPCLNDEVWRLEKIGKDGAFHKKLTAAKINTVQDFLKLSVIDQPRLREILGPGMSEKMWEATIKHARKCEMGNKHYIYRGQDFSIVLNPICQVERASIGGQFYSKINRKSSSSHLQPFMEKLVRQAYSNWGSLEETEVMPMDEAPRLPGGETEEHLPNDQMAYLPSNATLDGVDAWHMEPEFIGIPFEQYATGYNITEALFDSNPTLKPPFAGGQKNSSNPPEK
ncbi:hypothetical protein MLD38_024006 [Melastoma candidum]|uniref:Uncharacterized protein n=2 Tax=Melastoma candidum TaxID=119954 RepID=A0ACB9NSA3_9MYRT|nr:hypothetical protein MLD38_024003 [Melastoma candidum]KAI4339018.1 hypothetical protein MLD38_024006 [Melastoma candidum]